MYRLFSRRRVDVDVLTAVLLRETLVHAPAAQPYVVGVDATHIVRSSKRMPLSGWMRAPQTAPFMRRIQPGQRFEHCAFLTPIEAGYSRAIPLRFVPAPPPSAVADARQVVTEWQAAVQLVGWVRQTLDQAGRCQQPLLVLGDGAYNTLEFWKRLPAHTWGLTRTAKNSCLYALPPLAAGRGRPRKYGERAPTPQEQLHLAGGWQRCTVEVRGRPRPLRYRVEGPFLRKGAPDRPLFLLVVGGATYQVGKRRPHTKERPPAYYLVSAVADGKGGWQLPLPAETLLAWAWQRWEVEVAHREMKSGLGVGEMQCWSQHATATSIHPYTPPYIHTVVRLCLCSAHSRCLPHLAPHRRPPAPRQVATAPPPPLVAQHRLAHLPHRTLVARRFRLGCPPFRSRLAENRQLGPHLAQCHPRQWRHLMPCPAEHPLHMPCMLAQKAKLQRAVSNRTSRNTLAGGCARARGFPTGSKPIPE